MPKLYHFPLDPYGRRLRLAFAEYGEDVELQEERPWEPSEDVARLNPAGVVPILVDNDGTVVSGIEALSEYLEETRGKRLALIPGTVAQRAEIRRLIGWFDTKFYAEVTEPILSEKIVRRFLPREMGGGAPEMTRVRRALDQIKVHLDYVGQLADRRRWLAGDQLSMADLAAAAHLSAIDYMGNVPWAEFSSAKGWFQRLKSRPSFRPLLSDSVRGVSPPSSYADLDF
jgi:glutathione S-transferase